MFLVTSALFSSSHLIFLVTSFPSYICSLFLFTSARYVLHSKDLCCVSRICAVFQIFLFTCALLFAIEFALSDPTQRQSALGTVTKVFSYLHLQVSYWFARVREVQVRYWNSAPKAHLQVRYWFARVREVRSCSHRAMDICAVFQLFLFTTALLIRARVCAQWPHTMAVYAGDCHHGLHLLYKCLRCVCFSFEFVATLNSGNLRWRVSLRTRKCQRVLLRSH